MMGNVNLWPPGFTSADRALMYRIAASLDDITQRLDAIMTEDATIAAAAADIETDVGLIKASLASSAAAIAALQAEVAAGTTSVTPATLALLATAQADLDAVAAPPAA